MDGELARVSDRELERLAYGRASTPDDQARAVAAGEELARRADLRARDARLAAERSRELDASPFDASPLNADAESTAEAEAGRPWWRRPIAVATAGVLVLGAAAVLAVVTALEAPPPAFAIFEREPTGEERDLRPVLRAGDHLSPTGPRVLDAAGYGTVVAWLPRPAGTIRQTLDDGINPIDGPPQVCVGVIEEDPVARALVVADHRCAETAAFADEGLSQLLQGRGGRYDLEWSPSGTVELDVSISEAQRSAMEPGFRRIFLPGALPPVPYPQDTAALLYGHAGYIDTSIRLITPMGEVVESATPIDELLIAFTAGIVGDGGTAADGAELACLAIVTDEEVRELACTDVGSLAAGGGLSLGATRGIATFVVAWSSDGEVSLQGSTPR